MALSLLRRLASAAPVPVFAVTGGGARDAVQDLRLHPGLDIVTTPRHASVLLVAGRIPRRLVRPVALVHDQMPPPRTTVRWTGSGAGRLHPRFPEVRVVGPDGDVSAALIEAHRRVLTEGGDGGEADILPDRPARPWEGIGPHGQGGQGMMGGHPYGRPLPMTGPDVRDGLALDRVPLRVGPFLPGLPPGLALDVEVQGDVLQSVDVAPNPFADGEGASGGPVDIPPARTTLDGGFWIAEVELARSRSHLRWTASFLDLLGLGAFAARVLRVAREATADDVPRVRRLARVLRGNRTLAWATQGVGVLPPDVETAGPVARASGRALDLRADDPGYRNLGFEVITHDGGDAWARFRQRLAEAEQSLRLAGRATRDDAASRGPVEGPRGGVRTAHSGEGVPVPVRALEDVLVGLEWGDAITTIASLDLDLEAAARTEREAAA